jgi:hypothetical protein
MGEHSFYFVIQNVESKTYYSRILTQWVYNINNAKTFDTPDQAYTFMADHSKFPFDGVFELHIVKRKL